MERKHFIIDKDNGKPKPNMEYIYQLDMVWKPHQLGSFPIKKGTIVTDVVQLEYGSYEFKCKETGQVFATTYSWALAENTPENVKKIEFYEQEFLRFKEFEKFITSLRNNITTLKPNDTREN